MPAQPDPAVAEELMARLQGRGGPLGVRQMPRDDLEGPPGMAGIRGALAGFRPMSPPAGPVTDVMEPPPDSGIEGAAPSPSLGKMSGAPPANGTFGAGPPLGARPATGGGLYGDIARAGIGRMRPKPVRNSMAGLEKGY